MRNLFLLSASVLALQATRVDAQTDDSDRITAASDTVETVDIYGNRPGIAATAAPTRSPLEAIQPKTLLNSHYLRDIAPPQSDYLAAIEFAPSSSNSTPNGMGLSSKNGAVRGFQDGQYNVTFDGIPFSDPSAFGHATTSFFPAP